MRPLVVQQSFPDPRPTTNPYLVMLKRAIEAQPDAELRTFTWAAALFGRYDVFHVHWPEILVSGHSPLKKAVRQLLTLALVARLALTRTPIVRTAHNLDLPQGISRRERALLRLIDRSTVLRIRLNPLTPVPQGSAVETIVHGDYREWFAACRRREPVARRLAYAGLIRRYKGVEALVAAFHDGFRSTDASLTVSGQPSSDELVARLREAAAGDPRVSFHFHFLTDDELVAAITEAELVVLPYREMHNSGGALAALSLDRPVLVPDNAVNRLLAEEVGARWVQRYSGDLTAAGLEAALAAVRATGAADGPDLSRRGWSDAGRAHVAAYRRAIALTARRRRA
ncbi:glycosyltransferase [Leifsonia sp. L25]|uniref:glycosyltransferase n=1 Tax=Actinomycetes TaxID=1760 RepID=UPI003D69BC37